MIERKYILVAVETAHIQSYIFASNRLRENVGASYLVAVATGDWALQILVDMSLRSNLKSDTTFNDLRLNEDNLDVEVIYSGGGNFVVLFADDAFIDDETNGEVTLLPASIARQFIRGLSRRVQLEAPGLKLTFSAKPFKWNVSLSEAVGDVLDAMKHQRSNQPALRGDAGLGVQIMGASTSMPAVTMEREVSEDNTTSWLSQSAEVVAKIKHEPEANIYLKSLLDLDKLRFDDPSLSFEDFDLSRQLDKLGRSEGASSYIAVVHADANGLGVFIQSLQDVFSTPEDNRRYITYIRALSTSIQNMNQTAQHAIFQQIAGSIEIDSNGKRVIYGLDDKGKKNSKQRIELRQQRHPETGEWKWVFPIRPLISGGDDVTFVCDGRIGIDLATTFLDVFEATSKVEIAKLKKLNKEIILDKLSACAGIAMVKTHYPFARAYDLADELAGSAKQARHSFDEKTAPSAMDWHITAGGLYGDLDMMREREYQIPKENDKEKKDSLTLRPLFVGDSITQEHQLYRYSWTMVQRILTAFQRDWGDHQNKAEGLREALRKGMTEASIFILRYLSDSNAPDLPRADGFEENGWQEIDGENYCGYYDALELLDKYIPLKTPEKEATV